MISRTADYDKPRCVSPLLKGLCHDDSAVFWSKLLGHQPRSQGLLSSRPGGGKMRDSGNEVAWTFDKEPVL